MDRSVFSDSVFAEVNYQQGTISDEGTDCLLFFSFFVVGFFCLYTCFFFVLILGIQKMMFLAELSCMQWSTMGNKIWLSMHP